MNHKKVEKYKARLVELRELRYVGQSDPEKEKAVLAVMDSLWESMTTEERNNFKKTNHLSWPPPRKKKRDK